MVIYSAIISYAIRQYVLNINNAASRELTYLSIYPFLNKEVIEFINKNRLEVIYIKLKTIFK